MDGRLPKGYQAELHSSAQEASIEWEPACLLRKWQIVHGLMMEGWPSKQVYLTPVAAQ